MNNIDFIYSLLKYYGKYNKSDIERLYIENDIKQTIYNLRKEQKKYKLVKDAYSYPKNKKRAIEKLKILYPFIKGSKNILDFGGGSCDISFVIGKTLKLDKKDILCSDLEKFGNIKWEHNPNITFIPSNKLSIIPDNSIDTIFAFYVFHHIPNKVLKNIVNELYRILKPNGLLIIQEHNSPNKQFAEKLDLQHIIYDVVLSQETTYDKFMKTYISNYKSIEQWNKVLKKFKLYKIIKLKSLTKNYFGLYKK